MPEPAQEASAPAAIQASLHAIAELLRGPHPLTPEAQSALADYMDELSALVASPQAPPDAVKHLADSTAHLIGVLQHHRSNSGLLTAARNRLDQAILGIEAHAPVAAGVARRFLDALANIGI
jgi:hypothetical protein